MAEVFVGLGTFKDRKKRGMKKKAPCLHLWLVSVIAWSAISSSPTGAVSCAAGRQPKQPRAPRTLAVVAGGLCNTWPHPGMTSAGRGKWTGRGEGGTVSSHRLYSKQNKNKPFFSQVWFVNEFVYHSHTQTSCWVGKMRAGLLVTTTWMKWKWSFVMQSVFFVFKPKL